MSNKITSFIIELYWYCQQIKLYGYIKNQKAVLFDVSDHGKNLIDSSDNVLLVKISFFSLNKLYQNPFISGFKIRLTTVPMKFAILLLLLKGSKMV